MYWLNISRGFLLYISWTFGMAAASVTIITSISKRNKLPKWFVLLSFSPSPHHQNTWHKLNLLCRGGVLTGFACIFMLFSCAIHLPMTILWDDTCRDMTNRNGTDFGSTVVSLLSVKELDKWRDSFCPVYSLYSCYFEELFELLKQYPIPREYTTMSRST